MANLSPTDLTTLRRLYIRDEHIPASGTTMRSDLSRYNKAASANYWSDSDLQALHARVLSLYGGDLVAYKAEAYQDNVNDGDDDAQATIDATAAELHMRLSLVRAEAWTLMIADPAFRATLMVGDDSGAMNALLAAWQAQIDEDYGAISGGGPGLISVPLERR